MFWVDWLSDFDLTLRWFTLFWWNLIKSRIAVYVMGVWASWRIICTIRFYFLFWCKISHTTFAQIQQILSWIMCVWFAPCSAVLTCDLDIDNLALVIAELWSFQIMPSFQWGTLRRRRWTIWFEWTCWRNAIAIIVKLILIKLLFHVLCQIIDAVIHLMRWYWVGHFYRWVEVVYIFFKELFLVFFLNVEGT